MSVTTPAGTFIQTLEEAIKKLEEAAAAEIEDTTLGSFWGLNIRNVQKSLRVFSKNDCARRKGVQNQ